jgi:hypothetical protein
MLSGHLQVSFTADRPYLASKVCTGFGSRMVDYSLRASGVLQEVLDAVLWLSFRKLQELSIPRRESLYDAIL